MNYDLFEYRRSNENTEGYRSVFRIYTKYDDEWFCQKNGITYVDGVEYLHGRKSASDDHVDGGLSTFEKLRDVWQTLKMYDPKISGDYRNWLDYKNHPVSVDVISDLLSPKFISSPYGVDLLKISDTSPIANEDQKEYLRDIELAWSHVKFYQDREKEAIEAIARLTYYKNPLPEPLCIYADFNYDHEARLLLVTLDVPDFARIKITKTAKNFKTTEVSAIEKKKQCERLLYSLCIRAAYLVAKSDSADICDTVAINANQKWFDSASGQPEEGIIASLQARKEDLLRLQFDHIDPKACFRHLKGIATPSTEYVSKIRPIVTFDKNDRRIIESRDVDESLIPDTNLASMPWDDFEHLVRQLFEWEFGQNGVEVKVTQASRDRGVDAIMFDPDPFRGGKYVFQAKRYTRTVDVSSVRDLYGTVVNEGANRGVLVTTSGFGPDSYEFAKDKPISLVDGPALVQLLRKHGRMYRINLEEARIINESFHRTN